MVFAEKALGVNLVDFLRARRARRKPAVLGDHLNPTDRAAVSGSSRENLLDFLARDFARVDVIRRQSLKSGFLLECSGSLDALVKRVAQIPCKLTVDFARIFSKARRDFRREETRDDTVFVGGPHASIAAKKRGARALFAGKAQAPREQALHEPLEAHRHL